MYHPLIEAQTQEGELLRLDESGFVVLRFQRLPSEEPGRTFTVTLYAHHGWGGGDLAGGLSLKLEREMDRVEADVVLMGHHHRVQEITQSKPLRVSAHLHIEQPPDKIGAICGTFLRGRLEGVSTYQEKRGYRPSPVTTRVLIRIVPDKKIISLVKETVQESIEL